MWAVADLRGKPGTRAPHLGPIFFYFHVVFGEFSQNNRLMLALFELLPREILDPPLVRLNELKTTKKLLAREVTFTTM